MDVYLFNGDVTNLFSWEMEGEGSLRQRENEREREEADKVPT